MKNHLALKCFKRFILVLLMFAFHHNCHLLVAGGDALSLGSSLRGNQTIISKNGTFELGFFNPNGTTNWYVGIWYAQIADKTIIWVANRETPIKITPGVFSLSASGYLTLSDLQGEVIWSSNDTQQTEASMATILDTGNFVLIDAQNTLQSVWESFENPTDHTMPTMKFWKGMKLRSWKSSVDPAPGKFIHQMNPSPGKTDFLLQYENGFSYYTTGEWTGSSFTTLSGARAGLTYMDEFVVLSPTRMYHKGWLTPKAGNMMMRSVLTPNGELRACSSVDNNSWYLFWCQPQTICGVYGVCGAYGVCFTQENLQYCRCIDGFHPRNATSWSSQEWWLSGCVRDTPLNCSSTDGFLQVSDKSLSDEPFQITSSSSLQGCKTACLNNCSCTAFAFTESNSAVCKLWSGDLLSIRAKATPSDGQPFFIRLAASDVLQLSADTGSSSSSRVITLSISIPLGIAVLSSLLIGAWFIYHKRRSLVQKLEESDTPTSLTTFTYKELKIATSNFAHKLGEGAFGSVFKGSLLPLWL